MTEKEFNWLLDKRLEACKNTLGSKSQEYSSTSDKLHNFKRAGQVSDTIPEKALLGMLLKHQVSLLDIVDKIEEGILPTRVLLEEKIGDYVNYLILLEALVKERIK